jgi:hypothetical protein
MRIGVAAAIIMGALAGVSAQVNTAATPPRDAAELARVERLAGQLAQDMARLCPYAEANDTKAYDECRTRLFDDSLLRRSLVDFVLWGRQRDPRLSIKESNLTQFGPDVFTSMYVSLFMFNGQHKVSFVESEGLYRIELGATFRNRMPPGQFPYPFWHEAEKWSMYQDANTILLYVDPATVKVKVVQFTPFGTPDPNVKVAKVEQPPHDGKWLWTDERGKIQPQVTLFDGIFSADNPFLPKIDIAYREFALSLREGTCNACHVPDNPNKMKRLVLLQSPAHAASEIKRAIASVERDRMPFNDYAIEEPLKPAVREPFLARARAFDEIVDLAKAWEKQNGRSVLTSSTVKQSQD